MTYLRRLELILALTPPPEERDGVLRRLAATPNVVVEGRLGPVVTVMTTLGTVKGDDYGLPYPSLPARATGQPGPAAPGGADRQQPRRPRGRPRKAPGVTQEATGGGEVMPKPSGEKASATGRRRKRKGATPTAEIAATNGQPAEVAAEAPAPAPVAE